MPQGSGDVKYHLGTCVERLNHATDKQIKIAIVGNPSHLEGELMNGSDGNDEVICALVLPLSV